MPIAYTFTPKNKAELKKLVNGDIDTSNITDMSFLCEGVERKDFISH